MSDLRAWKPESGYVQQPYVTEGELSRPRWRAQLKAWWTQRFWIPCPACGEMFSGNETGPVSIVIGDGTLRCACLRHRYAKRS